MPAVTPPPTIATLDGWLTTAQVARKLERTPIRVRQLADEGRLGYVRTPLGRLFDPASVEALLRDRERDLATDSQAAAEVA